MKDGSNVLVHKDQINITNKRIAQKIDKLSKNRWNDPKFDAKGNSTHIRSRGIEWICTSNCLTRSKFFEKKYNLHLAGIVGICAAAGLQFFDGLVHWFDTDYMLRQHHVKLEYLQTLYRNVNSDRIIRNLLLEVMNYFALIQHKQDFALEYDYVGDPHYNNNNNHSETFIINKAWTIKKIRDKFGYKIKVREYENDNSYNPLLSPFSPIDGIAFNYYCSIGLMKHVDGQQFRAVLTYKLKYFDAKLAFGQPFSGDRVKATGLSLLQVSNHCYSLPSYFPKFGRSIKHGTDGDDNKFRTQSTMITRHHKMGYWGHACFEHNLKRVFGMNWYKHLMFYAVMKSSINIHQYNGFIRLFKYHAVHVKCFHNIRYASWLQMQILKYAIDKVIEGVSECYKNLQQVQDKVSQNIELINIGYVTLCNKSKWIKNFNKHVNNDENNSDLTSHDWIDSKYQTTEQLFEYLLTLPLDQPIESNTQKLCLLQYKEQEPFNALFELRHDEILHLINEQIKQKWYILEMNKKTKKQNK